MQGDTFLADGPQGPRVVLKVARTSHACDRRAMDTEVAAFTAAGPVLAPRLLDYRAAANRPYFVTEYLEGGTVDEFLAAGPLGDVGTLRLAIRLAALLAALHAAGVAHGDFRGQNLLIARDGLFAIDFGCARLRADSPRDFRRQRQVDLLWLGVLITRAGTGRGPFGDDWGEAIEAYHDGSLDLGALSGTPRVVARALLSSKPWRRPAARTVQATLLRG
jgi:serine/threonine protein kinase